MAIQEEMFKLIENEIEKTIDAGKERAKVDIIKAKKVAQMLTTLSVDKSDADSLTNQYIANIKNICN